jgi:hypothetical protein
MTRIRVAVVAAVMSVAIVGGQSVAFADRGPDNIIEVRNTRDYSFKSKSNAVVTHAPGGAVENNNVATAWATCVECRTTAAAVQMVIVEGSYDTLEPGNLAAAINDGCTTCETFAYARQYVFVVGHPVRIGDRAEGRLERIDDQIDTVIRSRGTFTDMETQLDALTQQMVDIVRGEIARSGNSGGESDHRDVQEHGEH